MNKVRIRAALITIAIACLLAACGGRYQTERISKVGDTQYLDPSRAMTKYQGITDISLTADGTLSLALKEVMYVPEFTAPLLETARVDGTRANPVATALATGITFGLYPLIAPREFWQVTVGRQDNIAILKTEPDQSKERKTGRHEWVTLPFPKAEISVSVGEDDHWFPIAPNGTNAEINLNISQMLFEKVTENSNIRVRVTCLNCKENLDNTSAPLFGVLTANQEITFITPPSWALKKKYDSAQAVTWIDDYELVGSRRKKIQRGSSSPITWENISADASARIARALEIKSELPTYLKEERKRLLEQKPVEQISLTRDEFETSSQFNTRVRQAEEEMKRDIQRYNAKVDALNSAVEQFQQNVPKQLDKNELFELVEDALYSQLGQPRISNVIYDADLQRFIISVNGYSQTSNPLISFRLISAEKISSNIARNLKSEIENGRPFLEFLADGSKLKPTRAHIATESIQLPLQFVELESPKFETVQIDNEARKDLDLVERITNEPETSIEISVYNDPESERLRAEIQRRREELKTAEQRQAVKERLSRELTYLQDELKKLEEGNFNDDLLPRIQSLKQTTSNENIYALLIGISQYSDLPNVIFADRSAMNFGETLRKKMGIPAENIVELLNDQATGTRVLSRLRQILDRLSQNDKLIVYYAGHGAPSRDGTETLLIPQDVTPNSAEDMSFGLNAVYSELSRSNALHSWVILDSCFSGRSDNDGMIYGDVAPLMIVPKNGILPRYPRVTVMAAGRAEDFANAYREKGYRLFTYHLIKRLLDDSVISKQNFNAFSTEVSDASLKIGLSNRQVPVLAGDASPFGIFTQ
jgi:hypothetical protein